MKTKLVRVHLVSPSSLPGRDHPKKTTHHPKKTTHHPKKQHTTPKKQRPRPHWAKPDLAILIWPHLAEPNLAIFFWWGVRCGVFVVGVLWGCCWGGGWVGWWAGRAVCMVGPGKVGLQALALAGVGACRGWGPKERGPEGWRAQHFALFFLSRWKFHSFFWGSSRGILVVFEAPGRSNVRVWSSRVVV